MAETKKSIVCPDCEAMESGDFDRRDFLRVGAMATAAAATGATLFAEPRAFAAPTSSSAAETAVKALFATLTDKQRAEICFAWDHKTDRGLLRTHVSNNWQITKPHINSDFYTKDQQALIREVYKGVFNPEWIARLDKQLKDDTGGKPWGADQSIAIFGKPGDGKFEFVMTGRHMTVRADGNSENHVAFGGPIFHGHAASGFDEKVHHPGNVFWHQALTANKLYTMLDGKQQKIALVEKRPPEAAVKFRGDKGGYPGLPVSEMSKDQQEHMQKVLLTLLEPYRKEDQEEVQACLKAQGGLEKCSLAFYKDGDIGDDGEWDNWRVEGPAFVWYFRGQPHVHIWINVADDPTVALNARG
jgi:uncharacterized protein DUF3500